jgi:hypothetical protein
MAESRDLAARDFGNAPGSAKTTCHIIGTTPSLLQRRLLAQYSQ